MDLDLFFIIIAVLYYAADFISNFKKRKKPPNIPEEQIPEPIIFDMPLPTKVGPFTESGLAEANSIIAPEISLDESIKSPLEKKQSSWCNKLHPSLVVNGIIFAEILQPPRSQRPIEKRFKRRR